MIENVKLFLSILSSFHLKKILSLCRSTNGNSFRKILWHHKLLHIPDQYTLFLNEFVFLNESDKTMN